MWFVGCVVLVDFPIVDDFPNYGMLALVCGKAIPLGQLRPNKQSLFYQVLSQPASLRQMASRRLTITFLVGLFFAAPEHYGEGEDNSSSYRMLALVYN